MTLIKQQSKIYTDQLRQHYEEYFGISGQQLILENGPKEKLDQDFYVLEFKPNDRHDFWAYCSVGMSLVREDDNLIEVFVFSPRQDLAQVELITVCASYHHNGLPLNIHPISLFHYLTLTVKTLNYLASTTDYTITIG